MEGKKRSGKRIALTVLISILAVVVFAVSFLFILRGAANIARVDADAIPPSDNVHIVAESLISAHRAGRRLAPENTIAAFARCFDLMEQEGYTIDNLEFDLQLTKDEHLVLLHDDTLDRTSNCEDLPAFGRRSRVADHTLAELRTLEMWHDYDGTGFNPDEARICTLEEVFDYIAGRGYTQMRYTIEIKDSDERGQRATDKLYQILLSRGLLESTIVGTFNGDVTQYIDEKYCPLGMVRSASIAEVVDLYFDFCFNVDLSDDLPAYRVLQIPTDDYVLFDFGKQSFIDYVHYYGIAVQFWTVNDQDKIERLMRMGADSIITDYPDRANQAKQKIQKGE